jgi:hypothetical protein
MSGLSSWRKKIRNMTHSPAARITVPSPPGRWKARRSPRANSRPRTAIATRKIAASTKE